MRARRWRTGLQLVGLVLVIFVADRASSVGRAEVIGMILAAVSLPRIASDGWQELRHETRFGDSPVLSAAFVATTLARVFLLWVGLVVADRVLAGVDPSNQDIALLALAAACIPAMSMVVGPRIILAIHRAEAVPADHPASSRVTQLARSFAMPFPRLVRLDAESFVGANAFATGTGSAVTVAVSDELLGGPDQLFDHVVSHELAHIARCHLRWSVVAACFASGSVVALSAHIAVSFSTSPVLLAVFVLVSASLSLPFRWLLAWLSRVNERQADHDALSRVTIDPTVLKLLHVHGRVLLEPTLFDRLANAHPSPAERLELVARSRFQPISADGGV